MDRHLKPTPFARQGFTLVEVMIVVVIIGLLSAMVALGVNGMGQRRQMVAVDQMAAGLQGITAEARQQNRIYGLLLSQDTRPARYTVVQYVPPVLPVVTGATGVASLSGNDQAKKWEPATFIKPVSLPDEVNVRITPLEQQAISRRKSQDTALGLLDIGRLDAQQRPQILWFGDQGAIPVKIDFSRNGTGTFASLYVDSLGQVSHEPSTRP